MTVKVNVQATVVIEDIEIEADSYEDAIRKLRTMPTEDLISEGYVKSVDINDFDVTEQRDDVTVDVTVKSYNDENSDDLPTHFVATLNDVTEDEIESEIENYILVHFDGDVDEFEYRVVAVNGKKVR